MVREIGSGGMGAVYLAARDDDEFQKRVAIKIVKLGMDTAAVLRRFRHERQILANLDHPYIARLVDGGTTSAGRPYFVMDYVEGQPIDVFCRKHSLDVEERCRLFLRAMEAVAAILYELLTGHRPHAAAGRARRELEREICEGPPVLLRQHRLEIAGEFENIVLMAMRKEPGRRYTSVHQFAEDLRRYLKGWPVTAWADSAAYRARKFLRRNIYGVAAGALVVISLAAGMVISISQARRAEAEARRARTRLTQMIDLSNLSLSEAYAERISGAVEDRERFTNSRAHVYIGHRIWAMGNYAAAEVERILIVAPNDRSALEAAMDAERGLARSLAFSGDRAGAMQTAGRLRARARRAIPPNSTYLAQAQVTLGEIHQRFAEWTDACAAVLQAIAEIQPLLPPPGDAGERDPRTELLRQARNILADSAARQPLLSPK